MDNFSLLPRTRTERRKGRPVSRLQNRKEQSVTARHHNMRLRVHLHVSGLRTCLHGVQGQVASGQTDPYTRKYVSRGEGLTNRFKLVLYPLGWRSDPGEEIAMIWSRAERMMQAQDDGDAHSIVADTTAIAHQPARALIRRPSTSEVA